MRWSLTQLWLLLLATNSVLAARHPKRDYDAHDYYAVHLKSGVNPKQVSHHLGLYYDGPLGDLEDHYLFRTTFERHDYDHVKRAVSSLRDRRHKRGLDLNAPSPLDHILFSQKQDLSKRFPLIKREVQHRQNGSPLDDLVAKNEEVVKTLQISDPIYTDQWHLFNTIQRGHDINVTGVWQQGITGKGSIVCLVDDGLDMDSDDLHDNYFAEGSYDFNDHVDEPKPRLSDDRHGTRCAGEISAVKNNVCGVGVAYDGKVSGVRILSGAISDADEAAAMTYGFQKNQIFSCSWGPPDDGRAMEEPGILIRRSMLTGVQKGRGGLGSIYVFAIGNGAASDDNCNFDGYTNSIYSVSVGSIDRLGMHPYYSEKCSAQLVVTYSSGSGDAIHTTDVGKAKCSTSHGGTSAAGPLVAGIYALMLEVNPKLNWRDMQWITVLTAVKIDPPGDWESDWTMNKAVGKEYSHQFGYGKADAYALVEMAKNWTSVKPQAWFYSPWLHVKHAIPQGDQGLASSFVVTKEMLKEANFARLEHVTVTMNVQHTRRGDISVELRSPSGMVSHIATTRRGDDHAGGYDDWSFMSVAHWAEDPVGRWTVIVKDTNVNEHNGTFTDWRLRLWGESIDGSKQTLLPLPQESDDDDHDVYHTPTVVTTSVVVPTQTGTPQGNPDGHITRPVNNKITTTSASLSPTSTASKSVSTPAEGNKQEEVATPTASAAADSHFLPRPFPTFGVSKSTQVWIYGALTLILIFLAGLGGWMYYMRRKRQRQWMSRDEYGFEMVDNDDRDGDEGGAATRRKGRRAGELYDAFAEGSDGEAEMFDLGSDSEDEHGHGEKARRYEDGPVEEGYRDEEKPRGAES